MVVIATVFLAIGMLVSMGAGAGAAEPTADDIEDAIDDIESYEYETEMSSSSTVVEDSEEQETQSEGNGSGAVNVTAGEMNQAITTEATGDEELEEGPVEIEVYLTDGTYYMGTTESGEETEWLQLDAPESEGVAEDPLTQYKSLLDASDVEAVGEEEVDGTDTYVLELDVDTEAYMETMMGELGNDGLNGANGDLDAANGDNTTDAAVDDEMSEELVSPDQEMTVTMWVDCETDLPVKTELTTETFMEDLGADDDDNASEDMNTIESIETTATETTYFEAYNEPVDIELPKDAEDAQTLEEQLEDFEAEFDDDEAFDVDEDELNEDGEFDVDEDELADHDADELDEDDTNDDC
ncbi:hypothetical protein Natoc_4109 (plasmid) [Natronococcus occultus SP4]|uniref:Uncharacterized protein n=2 Tax=Natronococcus occultus TaxID=29288 RepID=L0K5M3_9EURY|nr:hypothetical protein Natoc_4109 [Natronococcus occultus SP4]